MNVHRLPSLRLPLRSPRRGRRWLALCPLALLVVLAGCGKTAVAPTAPPPTATLAALPSATGAAGPAAPATLAATATVAPAQSAAASPSSGELTVGRLADEIAAAWPSVRTYRAVTTSTVLLPAASPAAPGSPVPVASPLAAPVTTTIDESILPDRHLVQMQGQQATVEIVVVGGVIYARGSQVPGFPAVADPSAWFVVDPAALGADSPFAATYTGLLQPVAAPYAGLSANRRDQVVHPAGTLTVGDRACTAYRAVATSETGERIDITIALDASGLPCSIETRAGSSDTVTVYTYNLDLTIDAPLP